MAKYVDVEVLMQDLDGCINELKAHGRELGVYEWLLGYTGVVLPADVQEVKHGKWMLVSDDDQYEGWYFCSRCKEEYFSSSGDEIMLPNFCPNCGAKMDGEDGEEN